MPLRHYAPCRRASAACRRCYGLIFHAIAYDLFSDAAAIFRRHFFAIAFAPITLPLSLIFIAIEIRRHVMSRRHTFTILLRHCAFASCCFSPFALFELFFFAFSPPCWRHAARCTRARVYAAIRYAGFSLMLYLPCCCLRAATHAARCCCRC